MIDRRTFAIGAGAGILLPRGARARPTDAVAQLRALERAIGGRIGAFVLDAGSGRSVGWRTDERFCHCSIFKLSLAAMALREADAGRLDLDEPLRFGRGDIVGHSPVVAAHLDDGHLPIVRLAEAVQVTSDNAAANILLRRLGGPAALTRFWRGTGDAVSRIDSDEPGVNVIPPGTQENSTTPRAMAHTVRRIVLGDVLTPGRRRLLQGWMAATRSGLARIRAGAPSGWRGMDKTGTGMRRGVGNKTNDLAVLVPPGGGALVVAGYVEHPAYSEDVRPAHEHALRRLGEIAVAWHRGAST